MDTSDILPIDRAWRTFTAAEYVMHFELKYQ